MGPAEIGNSSAPASAGDPDPREIRAAVDKLLGSRQFTRSPRMGRFLRFAVDHALAGTQDSIKEYVVGIEVFDRAPGYDPRLDPIVRVEARRLRAKLKHYYASAGRADRVVIDFPPGAYAPRFRRSRAE